MRSPLNRDASLSRLTEQTLSDHVRQQFTEQRTRYHDLQRVYRVVNSSSRTVDRLLADLDTALHSGRPR
jgi:acetolactate synthase small subunit